MTSRELNRELSMSLGASEEAVWSEQPRLGTYFQENISRIVPVLIWLGVIFLRMGEMPEQTKWLFCGVALFLGLRPLFRLLEAPRTLYFATPTRIGIFRVGYFGGRKSTFFTPDQIKTCEKIDRRDGRVDLIFDQPKQTYRRAKSFQLIGFKGIARFEELRPYLEAIQKAA